MHEWCFENNFSLNAAKCSVVSLKNNERVEYIYKLSSEPASRSSSFCDVGVKFDVKLSSNTPIQNGLAVVKEPTCDKEHGRSL